MSIHQPYILFIVDNGTSYLCIIKTWRFNVHAIDMMMYTARRRVLMGGDMSDLRLYRGGFSLPSSGLLDEIYM